ncbi:MAG: ferredoxin [Gammaproteobacteria bacterium]|nr:ferredoxin [Gammaproteobacteria bacterium]|tara:strand:+ start:5730 stop:6044 length:315 start_codon:yes stop_codon:yes gene_type:complete
MATVYATDRDGAGHTIDAAPGATLMEVLRDAGLPVEAICGGQAICSTCHIYVDDAWAGKLDPRSDTEQVMCEDSGYFQENSRLACQVDFDESLDGIQLTLAPEY